MLRNLSKVTLTLGVALSSPVWAQGGMMKGQAGGMMSCPMGEANMGLMHDAEVQMEVQNTKNGVTVKWTSIKPEKAVLLQKMGEHMATMHSTKPPS